LRRAVPSFKVEVRRRPRLATTSNSDAQSSETRSPPAGFDRESHRVAAAAFEAKKVDASASDVGASPPRGRILPSLAPDEPRYFLLKEIPVPAAESDVPSRAPKRREQAPKSPRNSGFLSAKSAPLAESLSSKSRQSSSMQSGGLTPVQRQNEETRWRSLATMPGPSLCLATNDPRLGRTRHPRCLRGSTIGRLKVESEPSWLATSSAKNSNPANVGSGGCSSCDDGRFARCIC